MMLNLIGVESVLAVTDSRKYYKRKEHNAKIWLFKIKKAPINWGFKS